MQQRKSMHNNDCCPSLSNHSEHCSQNGNTVPSPPVLCLEQLLPREMLFVFGNARAKPTDPVQMRTERIENKKINNAGAMASTAGKAREPVDCCPYLCHLQKELGGTKIQSPKNANFVKP